MTTEQSFAMRLASLMPEKNVSAFARLCGVSPSAMRKYLDGSMPGADIAKQIADANKVALDWLITGSGPMRHTVGAPGPAAASPISADFALIPRLAVEASAGAGAINHTEETAQMLAFPVGWLHRMGLSDATAKVLAVRGDSMAPTLQDGDLLLVDTAVERVQEAGIYVVGVDDRILVKRIQPRMDGSLQLISENPVYSPEEIPAGLADKLRVLGRVRWYGRAI